MLGVCACMLGVHACCVNSSTYFGQVLSPHFGGVIRFVKEVEPLMEQGSRETVAVDESKLPWQRVLHYS